MSKTRKNIYSYWLLVPAGILFAVFFLIPTLMAFVFSFARFDITDMSKIAFIGFDNYKSFFQTYSLSSSLTHTIIYAFLTSGLKVVLGFFLGVFLCSKIKIKNFLRSVIFFPSLISTIAVGMAFSNLMNPTQGLINNALRAIGIIGPDWLGNPTLALYSVVLVDVWKGVGISTLIYIAGITAIPTDYTEAFEIDGGNSWQKIRYITLPLTRPSMNMVITLSLIGGLRCFDLIWTMTQGGPGFASDVIASVIYKQYVAGYYGLSAAGNVVMVIIISVIAFPLYQFFNKKEVV